MSREPSPPSHEFAPGIKLVDAPCRLGLGSVQACNTKKGFLFLVWLCGSVVGGPGDPLA